MNSPKYNISRFLTNRLTAAFAFFVVSMLPLFWFAYIYGTQKIEVVEPTYRIHPELSTFAEMSAKKQFYYGTGLSKGYTGTPRINIESSYQKGGDLNPVEYSQDISLFKRIHLADLPWYRFETLDCGVSTDKTLQTLYKKIEGYKYSDEFTTKLPDGTTIIENKGQRSNRDIAYKHICNRNNIFFFSYQTYGLSSLAGKLHDYFAFNDGLNNIFIFEDLTKSLKPRIKVKDLKGNRTYSSCDYMFGADDLKVILGCEGTIEKENIIGVFELDLIKKIFTEKAFCQNLDSGTYVLLCYNEQGTVYHDEINHYFN